MNEKSSCPVLRGRDGGNTILLLDNLTQAFFEETMVAGTLFEGALLDWDHVTRSNDRLTSKHCPPSDVWKEWDNEDEWDDEETRKQEIVDETWWEELEKWPF